MTNEQLRKLLFIDIETVSMTENVDQLSENMKMLWEKKAKTLWGQKEEELDAARLFEEKSGIFSEFSKVVCIGIGMLILQENGWQIRLKSLAENDEKILLKNFAEIIERLCLTNKEVIFCGHNIKEFDLPFLCRRFIINKMELPQPLQLSRKKPWEIQHMDTLEMWKFGDYKNYTSLALLAEVLGIPSPKNDIDGSMVSAVFWKEKNLKRIADYCLQDVLTTSKVFLELSGRNNISLSPQYT